MANISHKKKSSTPRNVEDEKIHLILELMKLQVDDLKKDIHLSQDMLCTGAKTNLASNIDKAIQNPISPLLEVKANIDSSIKTIINETVKQYFNGHRDIIATAFLTDTGKGRHDLHYTVVLKKDNQKNRTSVLGLLRDYRCVDVAEDYPIHIQIIPQEVSSKIKRKEIIVE